MARQRKAGDGVPRGYDYLTEAARLGADLRPAFSVLMRLPDTRRDMAAWLRERASACDPLVQVYLEMDVGRHSDESEVREEVVKILDEKRPDLPRRPGSPTRLVLKTANGYFSRWGFTPNPLLAQRFTTWDEWIPAAQGLRRQNLIAAPEFIWTEDLWRGSGSPPPAQSSDPFGAALQKVKCVPGCSWVPIPPALREELETELPFRWFTWSKPEMFEDILRMAARFGHPLFTVFADFARRQQWQQELLAELVELDLYYARFRDPPGEVPELQPVVGPFNVLCGPDGFWNGRGWSARLLDAARYPALNPDTDGGLKKAREHVAEVTGVIPFVAEVKRHPERPVPARTGGRTS